MSDEKRPATLSDLLDLRDLLKKAMEIDELHKISGLIERLNNCYTFGGAISAYHAKIERQIQRTLEDDQKLHPGRVYTYRLNEYAYNFATRSLQPLEKTVTVYAASVPAVAVVEE